MSCNCNCNCNRGPAVQPLACNTVISQSVTYASGVLTINIPEGSYGNGCVYGLVIAQNIPSDTIIGAPVIVTIGDGTVNYPLLRCNGGNASVFNLNTRTKYLVKVSTTATGGSFRMLGRSCCPHNEVLESINGDAPTA